MGEVDVGGERARRWLAAARLRATGSIMRPLVSLGIVTVWSWNWLVARAPTQRSRSRARSSRTRASTRGERCHPRSRARGRDVRETTRDRLGEVETSTRVAGSRSTSRPSRGISQSPNDGFPRSRATVFRGRATRGGHSRDHARRRACCDHWHDASWALCTVWSCRWRVERGGSGVSARRVFDAWPKPRSGDEHRR